MTRPRRRPPLLCAACGTPVRRGRYKLCPRGCGARLHLDRLGPCGDAHSPACPRFEPHPNALEGDTP